jgi:hypothetical protein
MLFPTMLRRKNGFLYLRKAIPRACRAAMGGRKELLISLKTRDPELAKLRWKIVSARVDAMLTAARRGTTVPLASSLARLTAGLDEEQREAFESYLLMKLEDDNPPEGEQPRPLSPIERGRFKAYFADVARDKGTRRRTRSSPLHSPSAPLKHPQRPRRNAPGAWR